MNMTTLFSSYLGMYATQSFFHALIASALADGAIHAWNIRNPLVLQRFRFALIVLALFSFPLYQFLNPGRSSLLFHSTALFDSSRWLAVELWNGVSLSHLFLALLALTALIFFVQELVPILRHAIEATGDALEGERPAEGSIVYRALSSLPVKKPDVLIIDDDDLVLFSATGKRPVIYVSTGLARDLNEEQIQAALAHEIAHVARSRRPVLLVVFFLRMALFFNPIALIEFRRAVRNEEKICDDVASDLTHKPRVLADTLRKFYSSSEGGEARLSQVTAPADLEEYSHNLQLASRIRRLEQEESAPAEGAWIPFVVVFIVAAGLNYFVV